MKKLIGEYNENKEKTISTILCMMFKIMFSLMGQKN